jgi:7,8-dihydropterin-6-yl-methyl-4-(beta-D-ribofuranosyl)aminobenzene 5'-phosphate synthase
MRLRCLVDNSVQPGSAFWGEHGLSFLVEVDGGQRLLFDTGASGAVLLHDLDCAGVEVESVDAVVLSHSHPDHTGGLPTLLQRRAGLTVHAHPEILRRRYSERGGKRTPRGLPLSPEELTRRADLRLHEAPERVLPGVWTSGEIAERTEPEGRSTHHLVRRGEDWSPDPYRDDLSLVLETGGGLFVVCGCCHAGLLNTLRHVRRHFGEDPVGVAGGTHLIGAGREELARTVERLRELHSPVLHLNHCTGPGAFVALSHAFEERVFHCPAGTMLEL